VVARILLAAAFASLCLAGCGGDSAVGTLTTVGDSLNVGIQPYLDEDLGGWSVDHHDQGGRRTQEGIDELQALGRDLGQVLVVSLGTNDFDGDPTTFRRQVEEVVARAGPRRCVIWTTIWLGDGPHEFNDVLRGSAALHSNLHLVDWAAMVEEEPGLLAPDGVHGTPDGYARRAEEIARVARGCLPPAEPA
jgi:lysophospholipase L1-like esterase